MNNQGAIIAIGLILGIASVLIVLVWRLGGLAKNDPEAKTAFLNLMHPAALVSMLIVFGVLGLLGMAILDLDKGGVLIGMGKAPFARGLITYLFAVVTIGTAVVLVLSALLGAQKEAFERGKEVLGLLLGLFGTIVGFYFASELNRDTELKLAVSSIMTDAKELKPGGKTTLTAFVRGGTPPYRFAISIGKEALPSEYPEIARGDGWIVKDFIIPADSAPGAKTLVLGVQDLSKNKIEAETYIEVSKDPAR